MINVEQNCENDRDYIYEEIRRVKMKDKLIKIIQECDKINHGVYSHAEFSPSSSIEEIAECIYRVIQEATSKAK